MVKNAFIFGIFLSLGAAAQAQSSSPAPIGPSLNLGTGTVAAGQGTYGSGNISTDGLHSVLQSTINTVTYGGTGLPNYGAGVTSRIGTVTGTCASQQCYANDFWIQQWNVNRQNGTNGGNFNVYTNVGGSNMQGGYINFNSTEYINENTADTANAYYQAGNFNSSASASSGGTASAYLGANFALGIYATLSAGAQYWNQNSGVELDLSVATGASVHRVGGFSVVLLNSNAVAGDYENYGFAVAAAGGAVPTMECGYCFGTYDGPTGMAPGASLFAVQAPGGNIGSMSVTNGFYFPHTTFTGDSWNDGHIIFTGAGGISVNGSEGVSCAGTPSASYATVNGIVTHC